ncbi:MAG: zinc-binding dehydrogenase [Anaerolineae bacterium]|jgi:NADPH:quinone reductase-like Zn-dependent oxidoreductase|nr:zinc-binding dehydrogenase [Anaerolineae bacterium]
MTMNAVRFHRYGAPDVLQYETLPMPQPGMGEILIKVESASVNYSDTIRRSGGLYPFPTPLPFVPGSEVAGVVEALGEGVDGPPMGTPVFALAGQGSNGYAQYVTTPAGQVIPIPPGITPDNAAGLPVAGTTALLILREVGQLQAGESVLIQGAAGGVGGYAVQLAKLLGAGLVIGATSSAEKGQVALASGADKVINYSQAGWGQQVREMTGGRGVDLVLEMGGDTFAEALNCLAPFGRMVVYGMASGQPLSLDEQNSNHFFYSPSPNQSIHVFNLGLWFGMKPQQAGKAMGDLIGYVASGQVKTPHIHSLPLSQAAEAHRLMEQRLSTGKLILKPWAD